MVDRVVKTRVQESPSGEKKITRTYASGKTTTTGKTPSRKKPSRKRYTPTPINVDLETGRVHERRVVRTEQVSRTEAPRVVSIDTKGSRGHAPAGIGKLQYLKSQGVKTTYDGREVTGVQQGRMGGMATDIRREQQRRLDETARRMGAETPQQMEQARRVAKYNLMAERARESKYFRSDPARMQALGEEKGQLTQLIESQYPTVGLGILDTKKPTLAYTGTGEGRGIEEGVAEVPVSLAGALRTGAGVHTLQPTIRDRETGEIVSAPIDKEREDKVSRVISGIATPSKILQERWVSPTQRSAEEAEGSEFLRESIKVRAEQVVKESEELNKEAEELTKLIKESPSGNKALFERIETYQEKSKKLDADWERSGAVLNILAKTPERQYVESLISPEKKLFKTTKVFKEKVDVREKEATQAEKVYNELLDLRRNPPKDKEGKYINYGPERDKYEKDVSNLQQKYYSLGGTTRDIEKAATIKRKGIVERKMVESQEKGGFFREEYGGLKYVPERLGLEFKEKKQEYIAKFAEPVSKKIESVTSKYDTGVGKWTIGTAGKLAQYAVKEPEDIAAMYVGGRVLGAGLSGAGKLLTGAERLALSKAGKSVVARTVSKGIPIGLRTVAIGAGVGVTGVAAGESISEIAKAERSRGEGEEVLAQEIAKWTAFGVGMAKGMKTFDLKPAESFKIDYKPKQKLIKRVGADTPGELPSVAAETRIGDVIIKYKQKHGLTNKYADTKIRIKPDNSVVSTMVDGKIKVVVEQNPNLPKATQKTYRDGKLIDTKKVDKIDMSDTLKLAQKGEIKADTSITNIDTPQGTRMMQQLKQRRFFEVEGRIGKQVPEGVIAEQQRIAQIDKIARAVERKSDVYLIKENGKLRVQEVHIGKTTRKIGIEVGGERKGLPKFETKHGEVKPGMRTVDLETGKVLQSVIREKQLTEYPDLITELKMKQAIGGEIKLRTPSLSERFMFSIKESPVLRNIYGRWLSGKELTTGQLKNLYSSAKKIIVKSEFVKQLEKNIADKEIVDMAATKKIKRKKLKTKKGPDEQVATSGSFSEPELQRLGEVLGTSREQVSLTIEEGILKTRPIEKVYTGKPKAQALKIEVPRGVFTTKPRIGYLPRMIPKSITKQDVFQAPIVEKKILGVQKIDAPTKTILDVKGVQKVEGAREFKQIPTPKVVQQQFFDQPTTPTSETISTPQLPPSQFLRISPPGLPLIPLMGAPLALGGGGGLGQGFGRGRGGRYITGWTVTNPIYNPMQFFARSNQKMKQFFAGTSKTFSPKLTPQEIELLKPQEGLPTQVPTTGIAGALGIPKNTKNKISNMI